METKTGITINRAFATTLQRTIEDTRWNEGTQTLEPSPLGCNTRPMGWKDKEGNPIISITVKMMGVGIGEIELSLAAALLLATNITNSVRNEI